MNIRQTNEQEVYLVITAIKDLACKISISPSDYLEFEDDLYQAERNLSAVWQSIRTVQRMNDINKIDAEALTAKIKIAGL